ncbi:T9SS type A sorting domain-containing protein [Fluviicola chungangensis]|uniref:T9SS type A sorting domain-containing protein n=1 Tax=Fluviicola chungangensis TaxID=2597671 RepID=A0A556N7N2_9FLAO|nr:T9SS type A sorting domain-containing protein [Fluviicola chungangensis]TSJ48029.1 T9SS type A sorting domain-containing protein [Fluviicola chungangensis]
MKTFLAIFSFLLFTSQVFCGWNPVNTGINDDFTSISFKGNVGLMTGKKGAYMSTNVGATAGTWTRIQNFVNPSDSVIYNHSQFYSSVRANMSSNNFIYFCGKDTVSSVGVIFRYNIGTNNLQLVHTGGSKFYKITGKPNTNHIYVVGNNGILVYFSESNPVVNYIPTTYSFDLKSISIATNTLLIGADDYLINGTIDNISPNIITFSQNYLPSRNFRDVIQIGSFNMYAVGKNYARTQSGNTITEAHQYYRDSLMGNSVTYNTNQVYIGTDNGIYKSYSSSNIMEFQPTSTGYTIYDIAYVTSTNLLACGNNGTILFTTDLGGTVEPYAQIDYNGGCLDTPQSISSTKGTVSSCSNYVDNTLITSTCSNYGYTFSTPGTHTIKLVVSNGGYSKTITKTITIVAIPQINLPTDVLDTILCKQGNLDITIHNSENGIFYTLLKTGSPTIYGTSGNGDGTDLNFQSITFNQASNFYLRATNSNVPACYKNFTDTISITVEKPVARVYFDIINAEVNEDVRFYQRCVNASNFEWQFTNSPVLTTSNNPTPVNSFTGLGSSQVTLIAGTANNCYDTTTVRGPFIYQPYSTDSSWIFRNKIVTPLTAPSQTVPGDIKKMIKCRNGGYFVLGNYVDRILESRIGDSLSLPAKGGYLAKYNNYGILKWCVRTTSFGNSGGGFSEIYSSIKEDSQGNILMIGDNPTVLVDNKGDSIANNQSFVVKLDSLGNTIWYRGTSLFYDLRIYSMETDANDDVYISTTFLNYTTPVQLLSAPFYLNGLLVETITNSDHICSDCMGQNVILKLDGQTGTTLSDFMIESRGNFGAKLSFDSANNLYLWGSRQSNIVIHEPSGIDTIMLNTTYLNSQLFICKFDPSGNYLWRFSGSTSGVNAENSIATLKIDALGDLYFTGNNTFNPVFQNNMQFINADNSVSNFTGGQFFVAKVNTNGITQWINGNYNSYYGWGLDLLLDEDTLFVLGSVFNNSTTSGTSFVQCEMLGQNSLSVPINSDDLCYFISKYDLNGNISNVYLSQTTGAYNGFDLTPVSNSNLIRLDDGYFLMTKAIWLFNADTLQPNGSDFGYSLNYTPHTNGIHMKFQLEQGVVFNPHYFQLVIDSVCYNYTYAFPDGSEIPHVTAPFVHIDSLVALNGMDSIIRYEVSVPLNHESDHYITICQGGEYEIPNDTILTGIQPNYSYTQIISSPNACDSFAHYHFFVTPPPAASAIHFISACQGENVILPDGSIITNVQTSQQVIIALQSVSGCDSLVSVAMQVAALNTDITLSGNSLYTSNLSGASFQWVNCNANFAAIPGETSPVFTPTANGNYAVIVTDNGCSDTSACFLYTNLSINELDQSISVYPNPTTDKALITFENIIGSANIEVYSGDGRKILEIPAEGIIQYELDLSPFEKGTYFVRIRTEENNQSEFILVKN